jgi:hypothetical protein
LSLPNRLFVWLAWANSCKGVFESCFFRAIFQSLSCWGCLAGFVRCTYLMQRVVGRMGLAGVCLEGDLFGREILAKKDGRSVMIRFHSFAGCKRENRKFELRRTKRTRASRPLRSTN